MSSDEWMILQDNYDPEENLKFESLFALSNGYLGIRGSHEEGTKITLPYLYINGVFDKSETFMRELAALPGWLGIRLYVTPMNYSGIVEVENIIDGTIINFYDAPRFKVKHTYMTANERLGEHGIYMEVATRDNDLHVGTGCCMEAYRGGSQILRNRMIHDFGEQAVEFADFTAEEGNCVELVKYVSMYTERECRAEALHETVRKEVECFIKDGFDAELSLHCQVYDRMWQEADVRIEGDFELDRAVRFNIFHLMSTGNERDDRVNVGAKLLTGEEYGGHAFWDTELFMLPFFAHVFPETAGNLENYRYHLLDAARGNARKNGYLGAQYPWESADDGTEQCPDWTIEPDGSCYRCYVSVYEHHVTAAVAYGIYNYVKITGDREFLLTKGAEILTETARFWASRCSWVPEKDRYEILQVTGPDEWHEPVNNNLYTNYLAQWNLRYVLSLTEKMKQENQEAYASLVEKTGLTEEEIVLWQQVQQKMYLPRKEGTRLLEQFEGYFDLEEVLIEKYDENDWPIRPEKLNHMNKSQTQIIKQADVVMLCTSWVRNLMKKP